VFCSRRQAKNDVGLLRQRKKERRKIVRIKILS
jgi:hypothetical protein